MARALTAEQQALAVRALWIAGVVAREWTSQFPRYRDDWESAANFGLIEAAAEYDPARSGNWERFFFYRVRRAVIDEARKLMRGWFRSGRTPKHQVNLGDDAAWIRDESKPHESEVEDRDSFARILGDVEPECREILIRSYVRGETVVAIGAHLGMCKSSVSARKVRLIRRIKQTLRGQ